MGSEDLVPPGFPAPGLGPGPPGFGGMPGGKTGDVSSCSMASQPLIHERDCGP